MREVLKNMGLNIEIFTGARLEPTTSGLAYKYSSN